MTGSKRDARLFLRADRAVPYGELMNAMNILSRAGYRKIALVGLEDTSAPSATPTATISVSVAHHSVSITTHTKLKK